ncbi:MAG: right-handed parallel beta-helix repeat-containing protein [Kiritimatiellae bacterium]|nr:right-handed parallel beta-helix repeat-containing protein [Kiritimatiellia bacterium]
MNTKHETQEGTFRRPRGLRRAAVLAAGIGLAMPAAAQVPHLINYQGRVAVSGVNFDGTGHFKFALLDAGTNLAVQAEAMVTTFDQNGGVLGVYVGVPGHGYTDPPAVEIQSATGTGAVLEAEVEFGKVGVIQVIQPGSGYTPNDVIMIAPPPPMIHHDVYWSNATRIVPAIEPTDAVALSVAKGLYSVLLGDENLENMSPLYAEQLAHPDVRLRVWFDDGINGSQQLVPDQRLAAVGYAMIAQTVPDEAITADKLAADAVTTEKLTAGAVTADKLAADAVTADKLAVGAVTADKIAAAAIFSQHLVDGAVLSNHLAEASVYPFHLAGALTGGDPRIPLIEGSPGVSVDEFGAITITESGSYYLTSNLTVSAGNAIEIVAPSVTLDLMGHTISSTADPAGGAAIYNSILNGSSTVVNGHIRSGTTYTYGEGFSGDGFRDGVYIDSLGRALVRNVNISGIQRNGIIAGNYGVVDGCIVHTAGQLGICAEIVRGCVVQESGVKAISAMSVSDCYVDTPTGTGVSAKTVNNVYAYTHDQNSLGGHGISAVTVMNSSGKASRGMGISATTVANSYGSSSQGSGISASSSVVGCYGTVDNSAGADSYGIRCPDGTVDSSTGMIQLSDGASGIYARTVSNSRGLTYSEISNSHGIEAVDKVTDSTGEVMFSTGGCGIKSDMVTGSYGFAAGGQGINGQHPQFGARLVINSYGETTKAMYDGHGIRSHHTVGSYGFVNVSGGGNGITSWSVSSSAGYAVAGAGEAIFADLATHSMATRVNDESGTMAIHSFRGVGCLSLGGENISQKYDMP